MKIPLLPLLASAVIALAAAPASAQQALDNWYQVEVIVFAQRDSHGVEGKPVDPHLSYPPLPRFLHQGEQLRQTPPAGADRDQLLAALMVPPRFLRWETARQPAEFVPLPAAERLLNPDAAALERSGDYRVLFHAAWHQPLLSGKAAPWLVVNGGQRADNHSELEGSLRLYQARQIHLETDLWLSDLETPVSSPTPAGEGSSALAGTASPPLAGSKPSTPLVTLPAPPAPPLSPALEQLRALVPAAQDPGAGAADSGPGSGRQVASVDVLKVSDQLEPGAPSYIDHPRMGMLVLVTPYGREAEDAAR